MNQPNQANTVEMVIGDLGSQLAAKAIDLAVMKARAEMAEGQLAQAMAQLAELQPAEEEEGEVAEVTELHPVEDETDDETEEEE